MDGGIESVGGSEAYKGWPRTKWDKLISHEDREVGFMQKRGGLISVAEILTSTRTHIYTETPAHEDTTRTYKNAVFAALTEDKPIEHTYDLAQPND